LVLVEIAKVAGIIGAIGLFFYIEMYGANRLEDMIRTRMSKNKNKKRH
jgi:hypothetical protein